MVANGLEQRKTGRAGTIAEDNIGKLMNRAYNHSKHAGKKDHTIYMNPRFEAQELIDRAISNFDVLFALRDYDLPDLPLVQRFMLESVGQVQFEHDVEELLVTSGDPDT